MKAVVAAFNQEKALVGAFSVITNHRMELFEALMRAQYYLGPGLQQQHHDVHVAESARDVQRSLLLLRDDPWSEHTLVLGFIGTKRKT